jgi:hypothetical protein
MLVPERKIKYINAVNTEPLDRSRITDEVTGFRLKLTPPWGCRFFDENEPEVRVTIGLVR